MAHYLGGWLLQRDSERERERERESVSIAQQCICFNIGQQWYILRCHNDLCTVIDVCDNACRFVNLYVRCAIEQRIMAGSVVNVICA